MRALIWKECHENLKWATMAALLLSGIVVLFQPSLMAPELLLFLGPIAAAFGAVLGFLQVFFESSGDKRALLLHRPLSPSRIFLGKAVAGVGLYLLAMGIPFAGAVVWGATPGHIAEPFHWQMALPGVADILTGVVYYFAGMLTAQREARWYASRVLALLTALLCSFLVWVMPEFWDALVTILILGTPMALAAWSSFVSGGAFVSLPPLGKVALAATFTIGLLTLGILIKPFLQMPFARANMVRYQIDREGHLLVVRFHQGEIESVTNLDGKEPPLVEGKPLSLYALQDICAHLSADVGPRSQSYRNPGRFYVRCENRTSRDGERWYYVSDQGLLLGYNLQSKTLIGTCGPDGFRPVGEQSTERFKGELYYDSFLWQAYSADRLSFPDGVYLVDYGRRAIEKLYTPIEGETVGGAAPAAGEGRTLVLTDKSLYVVHRTGKTLFSAPFTIDRDNYGMVRVAQLDNPQHWLIRYEPSWFLGTDLGNMTPGDLIEYDSAGSEIDRGILPPTPMLEPSIAWALLGLATAPAEAVLLTSATEHSIAYARRDGGREIPPLLFFLIVPGQYFNPLSTSGVAAANSSTILAYRGLILLSALACALACFALARRYAFSRTGRIVWPLCGLLFGPAGLVLMLVVQEWPARVACPRCGKPRVVTRDTCEHCGAEHAQPNQDGTEVFESNVATEFHDSTIAQR